MFLAIDCGNSHVSFGLFDGENLRKSFRLTTDCRRSGTEYFALLASLFATEKEDLRAISKVVLASVVPEMELSLMQLGRSICGRTPIDLSGHVADFGLAIAIPNPEEVGIDRLMNVLAARHRKIFPTIVIDFGTATTFDVITEDGTYIGGAITPGVQLFTESLRRTTANLPQTRMRKPEKVIGNSTAKALESGIFFGYHGLIEGITSRMQKEYHGKIRVVTTGGFSEIFTKTLQAEHLPHLTLEGIRLALECIEPQNTDGKTQKYKT